MSKHAKYSPSKIPRIIQCPGSVPATVDMPDTTSEYAEEGTMLHEVTALALPDNSLTEDLIQKFLLDEDQQSAIQDVLDFVSLLKMRYPEETPVETIEEKVSLENYAELQSCESLRDVYGTLDYSLSFKVARILFVIDWKYGKGIEVFPNSGQLKAYALGKLAQFDDDVFDEIVLVIGQPRLYGGELFKEQSYTPIDLRTWLAVDLVPALLRIEEGDEMFNPSVEACRWCKIKNTCAARVNQANITAAEVFKQHIKLPMALELEELVPLLLKADTLTQYLNDLRLYVILLLKAGKEVPKFKLVAGRSFRAWINPKDMLAFAEGEGFNEVDMSTKKLMSPAQAEKKLGRAISKSSLFKQLITKPIGKATLVKDTDPRAPLIFKTATDTFADYIQPETDSPG